MRCPAAPYHESLVAEEALRICQEHGLSSRQDRFGNIIATLNRSTLNRSAGTPPLILAAHLDHPAFVVRRSRSVRRVEAEFLGGVGDSYFRRGIPLRLHPGDLPAALGKRVSKEKRLFELVAREPLPQQPSFAVWDLPDFQISGDRITGRACDDLIGVATILHVLITLAAAKFRVHVIGVLSRAEEVGFHGALALAQAAELPKDSLLISLETSRELPPVKMGQGVILRVGDRLSIFDSTATRFLAEVAAARGAKETGFKFQRALMSGGACEGTAYQEYGYRCAAVCVALGNYHNCAENNGIGAEFVSLADVESMSALLQASALEMKNYRSLTRRLPRRLANYAREAVRNLKKYPLAAARKS